jgi:hypothetical protein
MRWSYEALNFVQRDMNELTSFSFKNQVMKKKKKIQLPESCDPASGKAMELWKAFHREGCGRLQGRLILRARHECSCQVKWRHAALSDNSKTSRSNPGS